MGYWLMWWQIPSPLDGHSVSPVCALAWVLTFKLRDGYALGCLAPDFPGWRGGWAARQDWALPPSFFPPHFQPKSIHLYLLTYMIFGQDFIWKADIDSQTTFDTYWFRSLPVLTPWCSKTRPLASDMEPSTQSAPLNSSTDRWCPMGGERHWGQNEIEASLNIHWLFKETEIANIHFLNDAAKNIPRKVEFNSTSWSYSNINRIFLKGLVCTQFPCVAYNSQI